MPGAYQVPLQLPKKPWPVRTTQHCRSQASAKRAGQRHTSAEGSTCRAADLRRLRLRQRLMPREKECACASGSCQSVQLRTAWASGMLPSNCSSTAAVPSSAPSIASTKIRCICWCIGSSGPSKLSLGLRSSASEPITHLTLTLICIVDRKPFCMPNRRRLGWRTNC